MAIERVNPYPQFNFTIDLGQGVRAGFQECSIGLEMTAREPANKIRKITGLNKATDITLKRGAIGVLDFYGWLNDIRSGKNKGARNVTINLMSEDKKDAPVLTWRLLNARISKYVGGPMNAKGTDVAMEELTLSYERLEME